MASSAQRDPLRELALLVRAPEPGCTNLGGFVADNAGELAQVLGTPKRQLEAMRSVDDEQLAPFVRGFVQRARCQQVQEDLERRRHRSVEAANRLGATARRTDLGYELEVDILLGELLADRTKKWVSFCDTESLDVTIPRHLIASTAPLRRLHIDLASFVDDGGLHFRWRGGRGGYNWVPREVHPALADRVLVIGVVAKVVQIPERRRGGAWLGHILQELGYVAVE